MQSVIEFEKRKKEKNLSLWYAECNQILKKKKEKTCLFDMHWVADYENFNYSESTRSDYFLDTVTVTPDCVSVMSPRYLLNSRFCYFLSQ